MDWLVQVEQGSLGLGALIVLLSFALYIKRTGDFKAVIFFWQKRLELTRQEFVVNRIGLGLMILGVRHVEKQRVDLVGIARMGIGDDHMHQAMRRERVFP